jgi:hypothetical protein
MIDKILHYNIIMAKPNKGGGVKETFSGLVDSMEKYVNDNVFKKKGKVNETKKDKTPVKESVNTDDSLEDHHNNYNSLESM